MFYNSMKEIPLRKSGDTGRYITTAEFAKRMRISRRWVYELKKRGLLPVKMIGEHVYRIDWYAYCEGGDAPLQRELRLIK